MGNRVVVVKSNSLMCHALEFSVLGQHVVASYLLLGFYLAKSRDPFARLRLLVLVQSHVTYFHVPLLEWSSLTPYKCPTYLPILCSRLSNRKFVIVCYEKVVRIPLEGDEILRVHRERTLGAAKALMNAKIHEPRISVITMVQDFTDVFPEGLLGLPPQRQVEFRKDLVHGVTLVAKSPYRLTPSEMLELFEQLQELEGKDFI
ncbi:hypothetical protein Tco_0026340 [Tanacetum coccineum]